MVSHEDVAEAFVNGRKATGSRMFCEKNYKDEWVVYSYGTHFPIAVDKGSYYLFNSEGYSNSTAKHKSIVRRKLTGLVLELPNCDPDRMPERIEKLKKIISDAKDKLTRVRSESMKNYWESTIKDAEDQLRIIQEDETGLLSEAVTKKICEV